MQQSRCRCLIASHPEALEVMDGLLTFQLTKNTLFHVVQCLNQTNNPKITLYFQEHSFSSSRAPVISVIIWWNFDVSFLLWLTWCCGPVDGQGWFCPLPQSEWARRGLLFLLPDRAGGLGAGRQSLVRKRPHFAQDFISSVILFEGYICRRFCWLRWINLKIVLQLFVAFSQVGTCEALPQLWLPHHEERLHWADCGWILSDGTGEAEDLSCKWHLCWLCNKIELLLCS